MNTNAAPPLTPDQKAAHIFLTELRTRIATENLPYQNGVEQTALDSLVTLFGTARKIISDNPGCSAFADQVIPDLNKHLRPVTAKWHPLSKQGVLASRDGGDAFRAELLEVQGHMRKLAKDLHVMAYGSALNFPPSKGPVNNLLKTLFARLECGIPRGQQASGGVSVIHAALINQAEWKDIHYRRPGRKAGSGNLAAPQDAVGLAFSGGGIRSATFCLGVAQVLAEKELMKDVDYLSTVSGGGYTGSFITRQVGDLGGWQDVAAPDGPDTPAIQGVRQQARYLRTSGLMDVWEKFVTFTAGTLLNWAMPFVLIIMLALAALSQQNVKASIALPYIGTALGTAFLVMLILFGLQKFGCIKGWIKNRPGWLAGGLGTPLAILLWWKFDGLKNATCWCGELLSGAYSSIIKLVQQYPLLVVVVLMALAAAYFVSQSFQNLTVSRLSSRVLAVASLIIFVLSGLVCVQMAVDALLLESNGIARWKSFGSWWDHVKTIPGLPSLTAGGVSLGAIAGVFSVIQGHLPLLQKPLVKKMVRLLGLLSAALLLPVAAVMVFLGLCLFGHFEEGLGGWRGVDLLWITALVIGWAAVFVLDINLTGPQRLYRAGLSRTFVELAGIGKTFPLHDINSSGRAPVHLINAAANFPNCQNPQLRERRCDFFLFSKCFTGCPVLGYEKTENWLHNGNPVDLATAMSISGAAFSANMGQGTVPAVRALLAFLNVRLGYWLRHPTRPGACGLPPWPHPGFVCLLREMFALKMSGGDKERWHNISDGGHIENLATYELLRRRCKFIVCVDGECDPDFTFHGLMTLVRHARLDLGVRIEPDLSEIRPDPATGLSRSHFHLCRIHYPATPKQAAGTGLLLYLKLSVTGNESAFVQAYRKANPVFPHQTTLDQFFDQSQFEAYRQLGVHVARGLFANRIMNGKPDPKNVRGWFLRLAQNLLLP